MIYTVVLEIQEIGGWEAVLGLVGWIQELQVESAPETPPPLNVRICSIFVKQPDEFL